VVEKMVELARLTPDDVAYDLGCGDGRIVITATLKTGCRGVGFDIDPQRVAEARENVKRHQVEERAQIVEQDLFTVDLSQADAAVMYLLPWMMNKLLPQFEQMKPGCRIVSHEFWVDVVVPDDVVELPAAKGQGQLIYLYTTPLKQDPARKQGKPPLPSDLRPSF
jgi:predicted RNA methylase